MAAGIPTVTAAPEIERRTVSKVSWRLLPLIVVIYFVAYMDRTNVGFASFGLNREFGFSATLYGWGAGIFFLGYFFFEVPSNVLLERTGARIWIARIMITWGLIAGGMAFIAGPVSFLVMRFLLGVAEAGFFPGMILYFTYWFPRKYRARVVAALFLAVPGSNALTAVISGALLQLDGVLGFHGWQWLFMVEAVPAIILAFVVLALMTDRPAKATWLAEDERRWLEDTLEAERRSTVKAHGHFTLRQALTDTARADAGGDLLHHRHGDLRHHLLPAADPQEPEAHRLGDGSRDRGPVRGGHDRHGLVELVLGPAQRAALALRHRGDRGGDRADRRRAAAGEPLGARGDVGGHRGPLRHQAGLLAPAGRVPVGVRPRPAASR